MLAGFYLLECADLDEAVAIAALIPGAWDGGVEVRPVIPMGGLSTTAARRRPAALDALVRDEGRRVLATLVRITGSWELAEDAVQDAVVRALATWPRDGVPAEPRAWLTRPPGAGPSTCSAARPPAARRRRRRPLEPVEPLPDRVERDDLLRLVFTCCHPALSAERRWRWPCGPLRAATAEVAGALLVPEATMTKRSRGPSRRSRGPASPTGCRRRTNCPIACRGGGDRLLPVQRGLTRGRRAAGPDRADEAVRLARLLHELLPDEPPYSGCSPCCCCRTPGGSPGSTRTACPCCSRDQDRSQWDRAKIQQGVILVGVGCDGAPTEPIPTSSRRRSRRVTRWRRGHRLGAVVLLVRRPAHRPGRARRAAQPCGGAGRARWPPAGLAAVDAVEGLAGSAGLHAARAELLLRVEDVGQALGAYDEALALPLSQPVRQHLQRRRDLAAQTVARQQ